MDTSTAPSYQGCRFPAEIIAHCVWLYFRFCPSLRDVQEMMLERGVEVSHEGIRLWTLKFGSDYAKGLQEGARGFGDTWHLDELSARSTASRSTCGGRWIRTGKPWISWCKSDATPRQPIASSASCSRGCIMYPGR